LAFIVEAIRYIIGQHHVIGLISTQPIYDAKTFSVRAIAAGTALAATTFIGFDGVSILAEEVENPKRNVLLASVLVCVFTGLFAAFQVYLAVRVTPDYHTLVNAETAFMDVASVVGGYQLFVGFAAVLLISSMACGLAGLLEILNSLGGRDDLPHLGRILTFEVDDLLPLLDAAEMLGFAKVADADIELTPEGKAFTEADILTSKKLFAAAAGTRAPLVRAIVRALEATKDGTLNERFFLDLLRRGFSEEEGRAQLDTAIDWGRYAELFEYRSDDGELILTPAEDVAA